MRIKKLLSAVGASLALCGCATSSPINSQPITKLEVRASTPEDATDLILNQLSDALLFRQPDLHPSRPPQLPLSDAFFYTRPRSSNYPNLCRSDQLIVLFDPVSRTDQGAATPVRAVGVEATQMFRFLSEPATASMEPLDEIPAGQQTACRQLDPDAEDFFVAENEELAQSAAVLLLLIRQHLDDAPAAFEVDCDLRSDCRAALAQTDVSHLWRVDRCTVPDRSNGCIAVVDGDLSIIVEAQQLARAGERVHWEIGRVHVSAVVTVADTRMD